MAWNEPGGGRDPWSGGDGRQGPPDLEEALRTLQAKLAKVFGGGKPGGGGGGRLGSVGVGLIVAILLVVWVFFGIYIIEPAEQGVVTRFGKYVRTVGPGPHWLPYFIEDVEKVNVEEVRTAEIGYRTAGRSQGAVPREALMLTQDENIVDLRFAVQYRVAQPEFFLFNVLDPVVTLRQVTESAVREIVGQSKLDFVLTEGRSAVAASTREMIQEILELYKVGIRITSVNMQAAQPPAEVQEAFADVVKAREDEVRLKNEAEAYANDILPKARGDADAIREQAEGYKQRVIAEADGATSRFLAVMREYERAPEVTRQRLYLESVESVLGSTSKVLVDVEGGNNLLYVPLDKMLSGGRNEGVAGFEGTPGSDAGRSMSDDDLLRRQRESLRGRSR
ncbi:MAG: FtsH protease activity modulator HflK [Gammaproteobacteria bacterium]|nr:FtsH protease activity modulator HflK [Gammaproteobacteria bacterium]